MGKVHVQKDTEIDEDKAREIQRKLNGHVSMWLKITNMGLDWNHCDRMRETCINHSCSVASMYLLIKDHKTVKKGELPSTRPVCSGCSSMGVHLSNLLSEIIDAIASSMDGSIEVISTEDLLHKIDEYNKQVERDDHQGLGEKQENEKVVMNGADATALYPNLEGRQGGRLVRDAFMKSNLNIDGVNYKEAARYVAMRYDPFEVRKMALERIIPKRKYRKGTKPGVTGKEPLGKESDDEVRWVFPQREPTNKEKRSLIAAALEIGVRDAFSLHVYQFGGKLYHQQDGGPIGMRLAGSVSRIVMNEWARKLLGILNENKIKVWLAAFYVDDVRLLTSVVDKGVRWHTKEKKFLKKDDWLEEDEKDNISDERRTAREMRKAMNSIFSNIQFTMEIQEDFHDNRLPTLDFACWVDKRSEITRSEIGTGNQLQGEVARRRNKILYSFFEKSMNSPYCILERSALPENTKISSLAQEISRRMFNTSEEIPQEERNTIIENYISKMRRSGYRQDQIENIVKAGLIGYERKLEKARGSEQGIHRSAKSTEGLRYKKKLLGKTSWFKKKRNGQEAEISGECGGARKPPGPKTGAKKFKNEEKTPITILFVPKTEGGELAKRMRLAEQEIEKITGDRIKVVERAGTMLKRILTKSNPWAGGNCGRIDCLVCRYEEGGGDCRRRNATYRTQCLSCKEKNGKESYYFGETARTPFERGQEHERDYITSKEDGHMHKHWVDDHPGEEKPKFAMKVLRGHTKAFVRQIHEAVLIEMNTKNILNSKGEFNRCQLPRLGVKMGEKNMDCEETIEEMNELDIFSSINDKKRKEKQGDEGETNCPASKRRKFKVRRIEPVYAAKRRRGIEQETIQEKRVRMEDDKKQEAETSTSIHIKNETNDEKENLKKINFTFSIQPKYNAKSTPSPPTSRKIRSPSVKQIISMFEAIPKPAVSKSNQNATTQLSQAAEPLKNDNKANPSPGTTTTT